MVVQLYVTLLKEQTEHVCFDFQVTGIGTTERRGGGRFEGVPLEDLNLIAHFIFFCQFLNEIRLDSCFNICQIGAMQIFLKLTILHKDYKRL